MRQYRCSADHRWLQEELTSKGIKAYIPSVSVNDPKQRKPANEISDWCKGDDFKLWSTRDHAYVPSLVVGNRRLQSMPTGRLPD